MGKKVYVENKTEKFMHVGPFTIAPGHGMEVDEEFTPGYKPPKTEGETETRDLVADLQKESMSKVLEGTALLNDADLQRLIDLEAAAEKPRKTLLKELAEIQLKRAEEAAVAALQLAPEEEVIAAIGGLNDADLQKLADLEGAAEAPRQPVLDAIAALQKQRAAAGQK